MSLVSGHRHGAGSFGDGSSNSGERDRSAYLDSGNGVTSPGGIIGLGILIGSGIVSQPTEYVRQQQ